MRGKYRVCRAGEPLEEAKALERSQSFAMEMEVPTPRCRCHARRSLAEVTCRPECGDAPSLPMLVGSMRSSGIVLGHQLFSKPRAPVDRTTQAMTSHMLGDSSCSAMLTRKWPWNIMTTSHFPCRGGGREWEEIACRPRSGVAAAAVDHGSHHRQPLWTPDFGSIAVEKGRPWQRLTER